MIAARGHYVCRAAPDCLPGLWTIVLAAGESRRFGGRKLLLPVKGQSLVARAATLAMSLTGPQCVVVLGSGAGRLSAEIRGLPVGLALNRRWRDGMSTSLVTGVRFLPATARGALILPADQYLVGRDSLAALVAAWRCRPQVPAAARYAATIGAPAILPRSWFPRLRRLNGDQGARELLRDPHVDLSVVDVPEAALDLDHRVEGPLLRRAGGRNYTQRIRDP